MVLSWEDCMRRRERRRRCDDMVGPRDPDSPQHLGCMALRVLSPSRQDTKEHIEHAVVRHRHRNVELPNWRGPQRRLGLVDRGHVGLAENSSSQDPELMHTGRSWADLM